MLSAIPSCVDLPLWFPMQVSHGELREVSREYSGQIARLSLWEILRGWIHRFVLYTGKVGTGSVRLPKSLASDCHAYSCMYVSLICHSEEIP